MSEQHEHTDPDALQALLERAELAGKNEAADRIQERLAQVQEARQHDRQPPPLRPCSGGCNDGTYWPWCCGGVPV